MQRYLMAALLLSLVTSHFALAMKNEMTCYNEGFKNWRSVRFTQAESKVSFERWNTYESSMDGEDGYWRHYALGSWKTQGCQNCYHLTWTQYHYQGEGVAPYRVDVRYEVSQRGEKYVARELWRGEDDDKWFSNGMDWCEFKNVRN